MGKIKLRKVKYVAQSPVGSGQAASTSAVSQVSVQALQPSSVLEQEAGWGGATAFAFLMWHFSETLDGAQKIP